MYRLQSCLMFLFILTLLLFNYCDSNISFAQDTDNEPNTYERNNLVPTEFDEIIVDTALDLDGRSSYVEIGDSETLNNITEQVTVSMWIKPTAFPKQYTNILFKGNKRTPGIRHRQFTFWLWENGRIQFDTSPGGEGAQFLLSPLNRIKINKWYHVVGIIDINRDLMILYINGTEVVRNSFDGEKHILKTILPLRIGCSHEEEMLFHASFVGQIDDVCIWNIVRTEADIRSDMSTQLNGNEPGLVGYWNFDDETDGIISDMSPKHNDGRLVGSAKLSNYIRPNPALTGAEKLATAAINYENLLVQKPDFYQAFRNLADIYIKTERFSDAEKVYMRALTADLTQSEHNDAINVLRELYIDRDAANEFITLLKHLKPKMEGSSTLHELLGDAYKNNGEEQKAELAYSQWIKIRRSEVRMQNWASEYQNLAEKLLSKNLFPETALEVAIKAFETAINVNENRPPSNYKITLLHAYLVNEMYEDAFQLINVFLNTRYTQNTYRNMFSRIVKAGKHVKDKDGYINLLNNLMDSMILDLPAQLNTTLALAQFYKANDLPIKAEALIQKTGFVTEDSWVILGPFDTTKGNGFNTEHIPENLPQIDNRRKYDGKNGEISWQKCNDEILNGYINLSNNIGWGVGYAYTIVNSPDDREVELRFDSDGKGKVRLNGIEVFSTSNNRSAVIDNYIIPVLFHPGKNSILVKVSDGRSGCGFYLRITDTDGNPYDDLKLSRQGEN